MNKARLLDSILDTPVSGTRPPSLTLHGSLYSTSDGVFLEAHPVMADIDGAGCPITKPIAARPHIVSRVEHLKSVVSHNSMLFV